jgi:hypothetical protein
MFETGSKLFFIIEIFILFLFLILFQNYIFGQENKLDSIALENVISNTVVLYNQTDGSQSGIYNGCEYQYERINIGHAFFESDTFVNSRIVYDGLLYSNIPILYDITKDELVTRSFNNLHLIYLANNRINQFTLSGHTFIRISADSVKGAIIKTGFYQRLYNGKIKAWVRNIKTVEEFSDNSNKLNKMAIERNQWYIYINGTFFEVEGKHSILDILQDKKKEIRQFIHKNRIRFRKNMDNDLNQIVTYYDELTE